MPPSHFHITLHQPEIPNNTGNIGRTCVATGSALHLIEPLGFDTSTKACRRAGLDYWSRLAPTQYPDFDTYLAQVQPRRLWLFTTKAATPVWNADLQLGDHFIFGKETKGLPDDLLARYPAQRLVLPMLADERSLNLATAVCAVVYEALRQCVQRGQLSLDDRARLSPSPVGPAVPGAPAATLSP